MILHVGSSCTLDSARCDGNLKREAIERVVSIGAVLCSTVAHYAYAAQCHNALFFAELHC
jgi:hypothetical protein